MTGSRGTGAFVVTFTPNATRELLEAKVSWRETRLQGHRLLDEEVARALRRIAVFPRSAPRVRGRDAHRVVLRRSGYLLYYKVRPRLRRIEVVSVLYGRRAYVPRP